ncbi:MAG: hypothetical protein K2G77_05685 [Muribaculaceae bacterium]|nr:hypothetical protein [Muribaculaceae bacterium]
MEKLICIRMLYRRSPESSGYEKSVSACICCHPTCRGFSHCPLMSDGNAEAHACICNYNIKPAVLTDCMADAERSISIWASTVALSLT